MKKITLLTISILFVLFSCDEDEKGNPKPKELQVTDGTAVGCIHIDFNKDPNVSSVILERREKGAEDWQVITGTGLSSFEDNQGYANTGMPPGKVFEYRIKNDWPDDAEYSEIDEGYAYDIIPVTEIEIISNVQWDDQTMNQLRWNEENNGTFINQSEIFFEIYRSTDSSGTYKKVGQVGEDRAYTDMLPASMKGMDVFYRIDVYFSFEVNLPSGGNHWESTTPVEGTIVSTSVNSGGNPTVNYSTTDLGQISASSQNGISRILEKNIDGSIYLGLINDAGATEIGTPELYLLNGSTWQKEWSTNPPNEFDEINYAIGSASHFLAGVNDSLCVYEWNGSAWSGNLTPDNLGQADSPSDVSIEVDNDNLYMAITQHPDYELQVLKYIGSAWDTIGSDANGIIASGNIYDITLEKIGDVLYLYYRIDNTLNIKHLNGTTWETDLTWTKDNISDIHIAKRSADIYFISGSSNSLYRGGVYKITSSTTVEEIISNTTDEWFQFPLSISIDSEDNLIVSSMYFESAEIFYPYINVFDGTEWKSISEDFSDGMDPVTLTTSGTNIFYVYGDASSENANGDPTILKSKKMSK